MTLKNKEIIIIKAKTSISMVNLISSILSNLSEIKVVRGFVGNANGKNIRIKLLTKRAIRKSHTLKRLSRSIGLK